MVSGQAEKAKKWLVQCARMNRKHEAISSLDTEVRLDDDCTSLLKENEEIIELCSERVQTWKRPGAFPISTVSRYTTIERSVKSTS